MTRLFDIAKQLGIEPLNWHARVVVTSFKKRGQRVCSNCKCITRLLVRLMTNSQIFASGATVEILLQLHVTQISCKFALVVHKIFSTFTLRCPVGELLLRVLSVTGAGAMLP